MTVALAMAAPAPAVPANGPGPLTRPPWPDGTFLRQQGLLFDQLREEIDWQQHSVRLFGRLQPVPRLSCWQGDAGARYRYSGVEHRPARWTPTVLAVRTVIEQALAADACKAQAAGHIGDCDDTGDLAPARFNSVLANLYRDGHDGVGWHSDNEPELGACATEAVRSAKSPDAVHISSDSCPIAVLWGGDPAKICLRAGNFSPRTFLPRRLLGPAPLIASASFGAPRRFLLCHRGLGLRQELVLQPGSLLVMAGASQRHWQHAIAKTARPCAPRLNLTFRWITPQ